MTTEGNNVQADVRQYFRASAVFIFRLLSSSEIRILFRSADENIEFSSYYHAINLDF